MGCLLLYIGTVPGAIGPLLAGLTCKAQVKTEWHAANRDLFVANTTCRQAGFSQREERWNALNKPGSCLFDVADACNFWLTSDTCLSLESYVVQSVWYFFFNGVCIFLKKKSTL